MTPGAPTEGARAFHIWLIVAAIRSRRRTARELSTHNVDIGNPYSHGYRVQEYSVSRRRVKGSRSSILVGMDTIPPATPLLDKKNPGLVALMRKRPGNFRKPLRRSLLEGHTEIDCTKDIQEVRGHLAVLEIKLGVVRVRQSLGRGLDRNVFVTRQAVAEGVDDRICVVDDAPQRLPSRTSGSRRRSNRCS